VNRRFAWLGGAVGAFAVWRWFRRKRTADPAPDPADTLRAKLDESRAATAERDEPEQEAELDPDARRRSVHEQARARLDDLQDDASTT
jgi:hypothetical protein